MQPNGSVRVAAAATSSSFRLYRHIVIGLAIALIAPFTALAGPFAIALGISSGETRSTAVAASSAPAGARSPGSSRSPAACSG